MQDDLENYRYRELVGESLRLELNFTIPLEQVTEFILMGEGISSTAVEKNGAVGENIQNG